MEKERTAFDVLGVSEWNYFVQPAIGASKVPMKDTPRVMTLKCNACGNVFEAQESQSEKKGTFSKMAGGNRQVYCERCDVSDVVVSSQWLVFLEKKTS